MDGIIFFSVRFDNEGRFASFGDAWWLAGKK